MAPTTKNRRRYPASALVVVGVALVVRLLVLLDVQDAPFWLTPLYDEQAYLDLAEKMTNGIAPPLGSYYIAPGYSYFLAGMKQIGADIAAVKIFQLALGVANALLIFVLGRRYFGARVGVVSGCLWSLLPAVLFHELLLLKPTLTVFCVLLALTTIARPAGAKPWSWFLGGLALGCASLMRGEMIVVGLLLAGTGLVAHRRGWPGASRPLGPVLGVVALLCVIAVPTMENLRAGGGLVVVAYGGGTNFYIGNHAGADGSYLPLRPDRSMAQFEEQDAVEEARRITRRQLGPAEVSRYWWGQGWRWWRDDPFAAVSLTLKKAVLLWGWWEGADVMSTQIASRWIWLLRNPIVRPGVALPLALCGIWLTRRRRELWPLWVFLLASQFVLSFFFVFERFRLPLIAVSLLFAGIALTAAWDDWREGRRGRVLIGAAVAVALSLLLALPRVARDEAILRVNVGNMLAQQGRFEEALQEYLVVQRESPQSGRIAINLATTYNALGQSQQALASLNQALGFLYREAQRTGQPSVEEIVYCHELAGDILVVLGEREAALQNYQAALRSDPTNRRVTEKLRRVGGVPETDPSE